MLASWSASRSKGIRPTTKPVPTNVVSRAVIFNLVNGSLKTKNEITVTKAGAVYSKAVATGKVESSIALNIQILKKIILKIPVQIKYRISKLVFSFNCEGEVINW